MVILANKDICRFDISMYDLPASTSRIRLSRVAIFQSTKKLIANLPYDFLLDKGMSLLRLSQLRPQVSPSAVLHNDVNPGVCLIDNAVDILDYIRMREFFEEVYFCDKLLLFSTAHFLKVDFFPHQYLTCFSASDPPNDPERAFADLLHRLILLHLNLIQLSSRLKQSGLSSLTGLIDCVQFRMLFIASLLFFPLKVFIFVVYPLGIIIKGLQLKQEGNASEEERGRMKKLLLIAITFLLYSLIQRIFTQYDSKFFLLLFVLGGAFFAKEKGYFDQGLQKATELIDKNMKKE